MLIATTECDRGLFEARGFGPEIIQVTGPEDFRLSTEEREAIRSACAVKRITEERPPVNRKNSSRGRRPVMMFHLPRRGSGCIGDDPAQCVLDMFVDCLQPEPSLAPVAA